VSVAETQYCVIGEDGESLSIELPPPPEELRSSDPNVFFSTKSATATSACPGGSKPAVAATASASATSYISQKDADDLAFAKALAEAQVAAANYRLTNPC
jgi:hypothetical protein